MKNILTTVLIALTISLLISCKKDKLTVNEEQVFLQTDFKTSSDFPYNSGWQLTLKPGGIADILPSGDIIYRGTYKISGNLLNVKSDQSTFKFKIVSETELVESNYGVILKLKTP